MPECSSGSLEKSLLAETVSSKSQGGSYWGGRRDTSLAVAAEESEMQKETAGGIHYLTAAPSRRASCSTSFDVLTP